MLTKAVPRNKLSICVKGIGVVLMDKMHLLFRAAQAAKLQTRLSLSWVHAPLT